jgi:hypothetical protein
MSGNLANGMKMAREAWSKQKCVNNLVTLFHCASRYENADTLLEFDNALNELSTSDHEDILQHFPRLSNSCVENEADGGGELLLGVQERWMNLLLPQSLTPSHLIHCHAFIHIQSEEEEGARLSKLDYDVNTRLGTLMLTCSCHNV